MCHLDISKSFLETLLLHRLHLHKYITNCLCLIGVFVIQVEKRMSLSLKDLFHQVECYFEHFTELKQTSTPKMVQVKLEIC